MASEIGDLISDGLASPLGDVIAAVGRGVAEAQAALDQAALAATLAVYDEQGEEGAALLRSIGYRPTFYVLPETSCEVQVSMRIGGSGGGDGSAGAPRLPGAVGKARTYVTPVDASFQQRYAFQAVAAAKLTFKIVPVPPPSALDDALPVPNLAGVAAEAAAARLAAMNMVAAFVGPDAQPVAATALAGRLVTAQSVPPLRLVPSGGTVVVTLGPV